MKKRYQIIDWIIEVEIYLYIFLMFLTKAEGIRNTLIFSSFALWLSTIRYRDISPAYKSVISRLFWLYVGTTVLSAIFSIDPSYSFYALKDDPLKSALLFPVIATVMSVEERLRKVVYVSFAAAILIISIGYYSYIFHDLPMLKPDIGIMSAYHNKFPLYLNTFFAFSLILYFLWERRTVRIVLLSLFIIFVFALILNTTRGGYAAFLGTVIVWSFYISKKKRYSFSRIVSVTMIILLLLGGVSYYSFSGVKERISNTLQQLPDVNERATTWKASFQAIKQRPLLGWGYGKKIFHRNEPFENNIRPVTTSGNLFDDSHNTFIAVLFHQGIVGFIPYLILILAAIKIFWKHAMKTTDMRSYILAACVSLLTGTYMINSMTSVLKLKYFAVVLGIGLAAVGTHENSHN